MGAPASDGLLRIVVASHTNFGAPWVVGSHQLAKVWARGGHRVLHVSAPITPWHGVRFGDSLVRERFWRAFAGLREVEPGLLDVVPAGLLPWVWGAHVYRHLGKALPSIAIGLAPMLRRLGFAAPDVLVVDHPQFYNLDRVLSPRRHVYRATDLNAEIHERSIVDVLERALLARVDCAIATSGPVAQRLGEHGAAEVTLIENGVEFAHFSRPVAPPPEYTGPGSIRAVYTGALDYRFDARLLLQLARARPDVEYVLIGTGEAVAAIAAPGLANVRLLGVRAYSDLPRYLQHAHVGLLPFNAHPANAGRSPMKFYEYAAAGLPVLATRTAELARRHEPFVRFLDPRNPALALDDILDRRPIPDPARVASRDWALLARSMLEHAMSTDGTRGIRARGSPEAATLPTA